MIYMLQVNKQYGVQCKSTGIEWTWLQILALSSTTQFISPGSLNFQIWKMDSDYSPHYTDDETEAQKGKISSLRFPGSWFLVTWAPQATLLLWGSWVSAQPILDVGRIGICPCPTVVVEEEGRA